MFDYSPAPESKDLVKFQASYGHFIGGKFTKPANTFSTINPATEQVSGRDISRHGKRCRFGRESSAKCL